MRCLAFQGRGVSSGERSRRMMVINVLSDST
jgi:hypothetical protein